MKVLGLHIFVCLKGLFFGVREVSGSVCYGSLNLEELVKMGLLKVETWDGSKSRGRKKKDEAVEETGCWVKFSFGTCMPSSRSKVDSTMTGTTMSFGNLLQSLFDLLWQVIVKLH